jgi:hypothetical protein
MFFYEYIFIPFGIYEKEENEKMMKDKYKTFDTMEK